LAGDVGITPIAGGSGRFTKSGLLETSRRAVLEKMRVQAEAARSAEQIRSTGSVDDFAKCGNHKRRALSIHRDAVDTDHSIVKDDVLDAVYDDDPDFHHPRSTKLLKLPNISERWQS
jgi:hypothetical protein